MNAVTFKLTAAPTFPNGASVSLYQKRLWPGLPPGSGTAPVIAPTTSATVESKGFAEFTSLEAETTYYAGSFVAGVWRWITFKTAAGPFTESSVNLTGALEGDLLEWQPEAKQLVARRPFRYGHYNERPEAGVLPSGFTFYAIDKGIEYIVQVGVWLIVRVVPSKVAFEGAFPVEPVEGQEVIYETGTAGVAWHFRYNASSALTAKWEFIGGSDLVQSNASNASWTAAAASAYAFAPGTPTLTLPLRGFYRLGCAATLGVGAGSGAARCGLLVANLSLSVKTRPVTVFRSTTAEVVGDVNRIESPFEQPLGETLKLAVNGSVTTASLFTIENMQLTARPVAVF